MTKKQNEEQIEQTDAETEAAVAEVSEYTRLEQAHYDAIRQQERKVREIEYREEMAKRQHKLAKSELEASIVTLREMIEAGPDAQRLLPGMEFGVDEENNEPRWRSLPISVAIHEPSIVKTLEEGGIKTIGDMADLSSSGRSLTSIDGIGEMTEAKIFDHMQLFWRENPGLIPNETPEAEPEA